MEIRKQKEIEHANKLKTLLKDAEDREKVASNKKFYAIARSSHKYVNDWLVQRIGGDKKFLDYCCGTGEFSFFLAQNGANVIGIDISDVSIKLAKESADQMSLKNKPNFLVMDGENLDFEDNTFDAIICSGVLHHLDIGRAYSELARVLKQEGAIICNEPLSYNPLFQLYRKLTPQLRTEWEKEHLLDKNKITLSGKYFDNLEMRFYHLATLLAVPFRKFSFFPYLLTVLETVDSVLLRLPGIKWLAWQVVFVLSKPKK